MPGPVAGDDDWIEVMEKFRDNYFQRVGAALGGLAASLQLSPITRYREAAPAVSLASDYFAGQQAAFNLADAAGQESVAREMSRALVGVLGAAAGGARMAGFATALLEQALARAAFVAVGEGALVALLANPIGLMIVTTVLFGGALLLTDELWADGAKALFDLMYDLGDNLGNWIFDLFRGNFVPKDPIILDFSTAVTGVSLTALSTSNVYFDLDSDGYAERTGWVGPESGLLTLDHNGNGLVDNGGELFGNATQNGFAALAAYDSDGDGKISDTDSAYANLKVWKDVNADGVSQADELTGLAAAGVSAIYLDAAGGRHAKRAGNSVLAVGGYENMQGGNREALAVNFLTDQINTQFILPAGFEYDPDVKKNCLGNIFASSPLLNPANDSVNLSDGAMAA